jgi:homoserine O-succinyltransferase/O-acetyltransferase
MKIAILDMYNGVANEGMRCILALIREFREKNAIEGLSYQLFNVREKGEVPNFESFDTFISTGGPGDPTLDEPWEKDYFTLIDRIFAHNQETENTKKYLFLICHSYQLVAKHLGIAQVTKRRSTSFGVMPVHREEAGFQESFFSGLPEPFYVVDSRDYQVVQPNLARLESMKAEILCLEKIRPHVDLERCVMAIRYSEAIFGTQFHPEADALGMRNYFRREDKKQVVIDNHGLEKYQDMVDKLDDPDKIMLTESIILPKFLERAYAGVRQFVNH